MATATANVNVGVTGLDKLDQLNNKLNTVGAGFNKLKSLVAGVAFGALINNAVKAADAIQDIADATGIASETILGFGKAVQDAGGSVEGAQQSILKFTQTINEAAEGSAGLQNAFSKVGVTLQDLATLSEEDLLKKTIQGLGQVSSVTERIALQTQLFGKAARGVSFPSVAGNLDAQIQASKGYAESIRAAAEAQGRLEQVTRDFQQALLTTIKPLLDTLGAITSNISAFESLLKAIFAAGAAYFAFSKGLPAVKGVLDTMKIALAGNGGALGLLGKQFALMGSNLASVVKGLGRATGAIAGGTSAVFSFSAAIGGLLRFFLRFAGLISIVYSLAEAVNFLSKQFFNFDIIDSILNKLSKFYNIAKEALGIKPDMPDQTDAETNRLNAAGKATKKNEEQQRQLKDALTAQRAELEKITKGFQEQNQQIAISAQREIEFMKAGEGAAEIARAQNDIYDRGQAIIDDLLIKKKLLKDEEIELAPVIDDQIKKIQERMRIDSDAARNAIRLLQEERAAQEELMRVIELANTLRTDQASLDTLRQQNELIGLQGEKLEQAQQRLQVEQELQTRLLEIEKQRALLGEKATADQIRNFENLKAAATSYSEERLRLLEEGRAREAAVQQDANKGIEAFIAQIEKTNTPFQMAQQKATALFNSMNSAIDNFVKTGKFSFKDFAKSIIQDLIAIELKAAASKLFSSMFSSTGGSFLSSIFGGFFANGGNPPVGKPSIVGEKGPELFVPKTAGTIIPNNAMGAMAGATGTGMVNAPVTNNYITNNISALDAKSVAQLFAENRKTLLGATEMARKEMPYGGR